MDPVRTVGEVEAAGGPEPLEAAARPVSASLPEGVLSGITQLLTSEGPADRVLQAVADALAQLVPHDSLILFHADPLLRVLRPVLVRDDRYADEIAELGTVPFGRGITGLAAETRQAQLANDAHLDPRAAHIPNTPLEPESLVAVPVMARDDLKGVLTLYRLGEGNGFSRHEFDLASALSDLAALAIDNAQIRARLEAEVVTDHLTALYNHRFFHERLTEELRRATRAHAALGLLLYDIDDFKRVNDTYGHLVGDQVLQGVASVSRETFRLEDVICRVGGEEFGVLLPGCSLAEAVRVGERLRQAIRSISFPMVGRITVSVGVAEAPLHASSPRDLVGCADFALLRAKECGKDRVHAYGTLLAGANDVALGNGAGTNRHERLHARLATLAARGEVRSVAHLRVLQSLSTKLNRLHDVRAIGEAITTELRSLIDYHNCRVFLLGEDGETLSPVAFTGSLSEYRGETFDALLTKMGQGLTGHVARTGRSYYTPDAVHDPHAVTIPGTPDVDESILGVPLLYGDRVTGVIVLSKLGLDQFDEEDMRLLETLAGGAAVAFENARLLEAERGAAALSGTLLRLSQGLNRTVSVPEVLRETIEAVPSLLACRAVAAVFRDPESGELRVVAHRGFDAERAPLLDGRTIRSPEAERLLLSFREPFVLFGELLERVSGKDHPLPESVLVAPLRWEPSGLGAIVAVGADGRGRFTVQDVRLARGIADIASLAVGNASRFDELGRTYLSTVEALANALEAQDEYTEGHCRALARMALGVGSSLGLSAERLQILELGALLHDVGKIGVPSEIIRKPGPLTAHERAVMMRHPEIGDRILAPVRFLQRVRPIVRASHERWDGHGYPDGLGGTDIPLEARIVFVCDAFHAMTTDRPYRSALAEAEAIRRLTRAAGTQFDPTIVGRFVELHRAGKVAVEASRRSTPPRPTPPPTR